MNQSLAKLVSNLVGLFIVLVLHSFLPMLNAQEALQLQNPSFEDMPHRSRVPQGWLNGGFPGETPPDIAPTGFFKEITQANDGNTYLVMVTRDGGTWERVGNPLSAPLRAGQCYNWQIDLARSAVYFSPSRVSGEMINFNRPIVLRIWGGASAEVPVELLAVSPPIEHEEWKRYTFDLHPRQDHPLLILEAMYALDSSVPYAGNILLDNASALQWQQDCPAVAANLVAWEDWLPPMLGGEKEALPPSPLDTLLVKKQLEEMVLGRIDIGLYELVAHSRKVGQTQLLLTVTEEEKSPLLKVKLMRKRLKAMRIALGLKISKAENRRRYPQLLAESESGQLRVWGSGR
jgi:hypothetical protein